MIDSERIEKIEERIGYVFKNKDLLLTAFTHSSFTTGKKDVEDNQRLEFLGDAVIGLLAGDRLYILIPIKDEGALTLIRSRLVSGKSLAAMARENGLEDYMRFSRGVRSDSELRGDRTLAALFEALFGAAWLDGGIGAAKLIFEKMVVPHAEKSVESDFSIDPRGELQRYAQRHGYSMPVYEITKVDGNGTDFNYFAHVTMGEFEADGEGESKRKAFADAAQRLLRDKVAQDN